MSFDLTLNGFMSTPFDSIPEEHRLAAEQVSAYLVNVRGGAMFLSGADVRAVDYSGWTPMLVALWKQQIDAANLLKRWQSLPGIVNLHYTGQMNFEVVGVAGTECEIEASIDLRKWSPIGRLKLENGKAKFWDRRRILLPKCFYRAKAIE